MDLDPSFYSRIHVQLAFGNPNSSRREPICRSLSNRLIHSLPHENFRKLGTLNMDGRRIRNTLKVAYLSRHSLGKGRRQKGFVTRITKPISAQQTTLISKGLTPGTLSPMVKAHSDHTNIVKERSPHITQAINPCIHGIIPGQT